MLLLLIMVISFRGRKTKTPHSWEHV